jgi:hypothetical protein
MATTEADLLSSVAVRCAEAEIELQAKGYSQAQSQMATRYAMRWSRTIAEGVPLDVRASTFAALVEARLKDAEPWLDGCARAATAREYGREVARAAKDHQFKRAQSEYGPAGAANKAWETSIPEAVGNWERTFTKP